jgi:hypothetical protein
VTAPDDAPGQQDRHATPLGQAGAAASKQALWRWASVVILVTAVIELAVPGACVPVLVAQLWFGLTIGGLTIGGLSTFWPPPSGPDAVLTLAAKERAR